MTLSSPLPAGLVLIALIVGFWIGLAMGGLAQQALDRLLRAFAVRRAVRNTVAALQPAGTVSDQRQRRELLDATDGEYTALLRVDARRVAGAVVPQGRDTVTAVRP
jgi:hypothetical protein